MNFTTTESNNNDGSKSSSVPTEEGVGNTPSREPLNAAEAALVKAKDDPVHRPQFLKTLLQDPVYFLSISNNNSGETQVVAWEDACRGDPNDIRLWIPAFLHSSRATEIPLPSELLHGNEHHLSIQAAPSGREFFQRYRGNNVILESGFLGIKKELFASEIETLLEAPVPETLTLEKGTTAKYGIPAKWPNEMVAALTEVFESYPQPTVQKACLGWWIHDGSEEGGNYVMGMEVTNHDSHDDVQNLLREVGSVISNGYPGTYVDIMTWTSEEGPNNMFSELMEMKAPFFNRNSPSK